MSAGVGRPCWPSDRRLPFPPVVAAAAASAAAGSSVLRKWGGPSSGAEKQVDFAPPFHFFRSPFRPCSSCQALHHLFVVASLAVSPVSPSHDMPLAVLSLSSFVIPFSVPCLRGLAIMLLRSHLDRPCRPHVAAVGMLLVNLQLTVELITLTLPEVI
ncbi:hypothetical protein MN608_02652 [Microdochium nivale]|nr:hypothetical protein MN608_02652 [Microdochium nivale]